MERRAPRVFYGWWLVFGSFMLQALSGGLLYNSFGAYFVSLQSEFGWSKAVVSGAYSMGRLESGVLGPIQGWLITRFGPRAVIFAGLALFAGGFFAFSLIDNVVAFYVSFFFITVGSSLAGFLTVNIVLVNWFERRRARAISLGAMGSSGAGLLVPLVALSLESFGWRATAVYSGLLVLLIGIPVTLLFRRAPEPYGWAPDGDPPAENYFGGTAATGPSAAVTGLTTREALRTPAFWLLTSGHTAALFSVAALIVHLIPYLVDQRATSVEVAATVVAALTGASVLGQLLGGYLGDRFDKRAICAACMVGHTAALVILILGTSLPLIVAGALVHGLSWGIRGPLMMAVRADFFGRRSFATIEGYASIVNTVGLFIGPVAVGLLADHLGDYRVGYAFLACITTAGFFCFALARRPSPHALPAA